MGRKPLRLMASVTCRWASPLNEGLGGTSRGKKAALYEESGRKEEKCEQAGDDAPFGLCLDELRTEEPPNDY
jgi:hypothetical protein